MKTRRRAKTIYTLAVHAVFWFCLIGFGIVKHNHHKQQVVVDAIGLAFSQGYTQVSFRSVTMIDPERPAYYACGTVNGKPAAYVHEQLLVLGRDPAAAYRLRRLCESGRSYII